MKLKHNISGHCKANPYFVDAIGYNCTDYERHELCTSSGGYGEGWISVFGTFEDSADSDGETAWVCPQCGCYGNQAWQLNAVTFRIDRKRKNALAKVYI